MKIIIFLFALLNAGLCSADNLGKDIEFKVLEKLSNKLSCDNYWSNSWEINEERSVRMVPISESKYLIAFELLEKDSIVKIKKQSNLAHQYQLAFVNLSDGRSVEFLGIPNVLRDMQERDYADRGLKKQDIVSIKSEDKLLKSKLVLKLRPREYFHDKIWEGKIVSLENELKTNHLDCSKYKNGTIIVHDVSINDEDVYGLVLLHSGKLILSLSGEVFKSNSLIFPYSAGFVVDNLNQIDPEWLFKILRKPLIWQIKDNGKGGCDLWRLEGFSR